jgi:AMP-binding enzyme
MTSSVERRANRCRRALLASRPTVADPSFAPAFALETPALHGEVVLDWVAHSQDSSSHFLVALERRAHELGVAPPKTDPEIGTDLYYDLVARHLGGGRRALRYYARAALSGAGHWENLTFDDLHARCTYRASWWAAQGIGPGALICVVLPFGPELAISLLAGLRLGAVVSWLEPQGPDFVTSRLAALAPKHLATEPFFARQLGPFADIALPPDALAPLPETYSYTYGPGEVCMQLFSPLRSPPGAAVPVTADATYFGALRDGLACLALRPGDHLAAPGFHALQHQPAMLFAAWILGAAYTHISEQDAVREPALLDATPLRTMGLTPRVRDAYLQARRGHRPPWAHVVRNPEEPCDWEAWRAFLEGCDLGEVPISSLVLEAAAAGALLSSARRPGKPYLAHLQDVVPAPGRPWQLLDFTRSGQPAAADAGVYARVAAGKKPKPIEPLYLVLARRRAEYLYGGTLEPRRCGRVFPVDEVLAVVARAAFLDGAAVVPVVSGGSASEARFVLVGFTGDEPRDAFDAAREPRCAELRRLVAGALGAELIPDRIELFPLYARRLAAKIDLDWSQAQYLGGHLFRKARAPIFQRLVALRRSVRSAAPAAPAAPPVEATWP